MRRRARRSERDHQRHAVAPRPVSLAILVAFGMPAHARTTVRSSTSSQDLSTDTSYLINAGMSITTSFQNAIKVEGIAPVTITSAGSIASSTDNQQGAGGYRNVEGLLGARYIW